MSFTVNQRVRRKSQPHVRGTFQKTRQNKAGELLGEIQLADGLLTSIKLSDLECDADTFLLPEEKLAAYKLGDVHSLRRKLTLEKMTGNRTDFLHSMHTAELEFMPHQFKPVLKFIESSTGRLLLADEVGLGKTIEASLIWLEMRARQDARRLLIICPGMLIDKWVNELDKKFGIRAEAIASVQQLRTHIQNPSAFGYALVASYETIRVGAGEIDAAEGDPEAEKPSGSGSDRFQLAKWLTEQAESHSKPFDLLIFDEAHRLRNKTSLLARSARIYSNAAAHLLLASATPINNSSNDLFALMELIDEDTFDSHDSLDREIYHNRPVILAQNALSDNLIKEAGDYLELAIERHNSYGNKNSVINTISRIRTEIEESIKSSAHNPEQVIKWRMALDDCDFFSPYISRTRRCDVQGKHRIREAKVFPLSLAPHESKIYAEVLDAIRQRLNLVSEMKKNRQSMLGLVTPQLRMASSIPAMLYAFQDSLQGKPDTPDIAWDSVVESEDDDNDETADESFRREMQIWQERFSKTLRQYPPEIMEKSDSKYTCFKDAVSRLLETEPTSGLVVFSYFIPTLDYLKRRLESDGISVSLISGKITRDTRDREIERYLKGESKILLSSEVGSEGIDLQHAGHVVINYDLPWNPMRIEQRIGRVDRIGQKADKIMIINFCVENTIEERVHEILMRKTDCFTSTLGATGVVLGEKQLINAIQNNWEKLTPEQRRELETRESLAAANTAQIQSKLTENESALANSSLIEGRINRMHELGDFISADDFRNLIHDFFETNYIGTKIHHTIDGAKNALEVHLTPDAKVSFEHYCRDNKLDYASWVSLGATGHMVLRGRFAGTNETLSNRTTRLYQIITTACPFIRWMIAGCRKTPASLENAFYLRCRFPSSSHVPPGEYAFRLDRLEFKGVTERQELRLTMSGLNADNLPIEFPHEQAMDFFKNAISWAEPAAVLNAYDADAAVRLYEFMEACADETVENELINFKSRNDRLRDLRLQYAEKIWRTKDRKLCEELDKRKKGVRDAELLNDQKTAAKRKQFVSMIEKRITEIKNIYENKRAELNAKAIVSDAQALIATGIIHCI